MPRRCRVPTLALLFIATLTGCSGSSAGSDSSDSSETNETSATSETSATTVTSTTSAATDDATIDDSASAGPAEPICLFFPDFDTDLAPLFPQLANNCTPGAYYTARSGDQLTLYGDDACSEALDTGAVSQALLGALPEGQCLYMLHEPQLNAGACHTVSTLFYPSASLDDAPTLALARAAEAPEALAGVEVSRGAESLCACSSDSTSGQFVPPCCGEQVLRYRLDFSIDGQAYTLEPGEEEPALAYAGGSYRLRVIAAEEVAPDVECSEDELASEGFRATNVGWILD